MSNEGFDEKRWSENVERLVRERETAERQITASSSVIALRPNHGTTNGRNQETSKQPEQGVAPFPWLDMSKWDDEPIPPRKWAIPDRVPANQAGLFSGEGGTGKSIIELTKDVAHVAGKDWLGSLPEPGPAFYIGAEDEVDEIRRRLHAIAVHYGVTFKELITGGLRVRCMLGEDATLCVVGKSGKVEVTPLYRQLFEAAATSSPRISLSTHCPAPLRATRLIASRSMPLRCICRPSRWSPAAL
jgi:hypothetical protein